MDESKNQISNWEYKEAKNNQSEQQEEKKNPPAKNKDSVRGFWDNFKHTNIHIIGVPEGEGKE